MLNKIKQNAIPSLIVGATVILALVAVFTATRLYRLRNQSVTESKAWDCSKYTFNVEASGIVTVQNLSSRAEPEQQAKVYINGTLVTTLAVPAMSQGQQKQIGTVSVPSEGFFTWEVIGTRDCQNSGEHQLTQTSCTTFAFSLTIPSPSPSPSATPGAISANCSDVKAYDTNWQLLSSDDLSKLEAGDKVRFTVSGITDSGEFDKARFKINGTQRTVVTHKKPGKEEFYDEYTVPANTNSFNVTGEVHHKQLDLWI